MATSSPNEKGGSNQNKPQSPPLLAASPSTSSSEQAAVSTRIISGSIGSVVTALCVTPLEVVKVHLQNAKPTNPTPPSPIIPQNVSLCPKGCGTFVLNNGLCDSILPKCAVPYFDERGNLKCLDTTKSAATKSKPAIITATTTTGSSSSQGTFAMIRSIFLKEGYQGIYAGLAPTLVMGVPSTVFYYTVYDEILAHARNNYHLTSAWIPFWAGSSARLGTTLLTAPLELVRTRQASRVGAGQDVASNGGILAELRQIVRQEGCGALYKGLGPTLWRDVPFSGIYWVSLEQFRAFYTAQLIDGKGRPSAVQQAGISFLSGASAGMVAAACTTPFDVVKTRQQSAILTTTAVEAPAELAACKHDGHVVYRAAPAEVSGRTIWSDLRAIYEMEGVNGLWRGNQTRMIKVAPSCAIMIMCYELGKSMLTPSNNY
ncbi:25 member 40 [Seminavis robusta]|uniref:25 member 40 n=1 Tax=Seminavis robusta TaxID=568900 RepID=A0A9N8H5F7_9STRA|nr:25 member 40 [Seminavis robusta]|eukprot:Sro142_g066050.1 25 member 40 (430) ;mRNA; r:11128-12604